MGALRVLKYLLNAVVFDKSKKKGFLFLTKKKGFLFLTKQVIYVQRVPGQGVHHKVAKEILSQLDSNATHA